MRDHLAVSPSHSDRELDIQMRCMRGFSHALDCPMALGLDPGRKRRHGLLDGRTWAPALRRFRRTREVVLNDAIDRRLAKAKVLHSIRGSNFLEQPVGKNTQISDTAREAEISKSTCRLTRGSRTDMRSSFDDGDLARWPGCCVGSLLVSECELVGRREANDTCSQDNSIIPRRYISLRTYGLLNVGPGCVRS